MLMKKIIFFLIFSIVNLISAQSDIVKGIIINSKNNQPLENVNIVNINQVTGTASNSSGQFEIQAYANDTLYLSYIGFKSIKVKVTNDWINLDIETMIELTEMALALEEVVVYELKLTGYLELDIKQVPINNNYRYSISGLPNVGYESSSRPTNALTKTLNAIFNPVDFLYKIFGREPNQLRKVKKMKEDDRIRNVLSNRFDREILVELLSIEKKDLEFLIAQCSYSDDFIKKANDLQVLEAISECYEEYKVLNNSIKNQ